MPGDSSATLSVRVASDSVVELTETFLLSISATNDSRVEINSDKFTTAVEIQDTSGVPHFYLNQKTRHFYV